MSGELSKFHNIISVEIAGSECWLGDNGLERDFGRRVLLGGTVPSRGDGDNCRGFSPNVGGDHVAITAVHLMAVVTVVSWGGLGEVLGRGGGSNGLGLSIIVWVVGSGRLVLS